MYLGLMGNIMFGVQVRKEVGERWRRNVVVCGMFSAAGVGFLIQLHGGVNANVDQNLSLHSSPNQPAIFMQDNAPVTQQNR